MATAICLRRRVGIGNGDEQAPARRQPGSDATQHGHRIIEMLQRVKQERRIEPFLRLEILEAAQDEPDILPYPLSGHVNQLAGAFNDREIVIDLRSAAR